MCAAKPGSNYSIPTGVVGKPEVSGRSIVSLSQERYVGISTTFRSNDNIGIPVVGTYLSGFYLLIGSTILNNAQRIYPNIVNLQPTSDRNGVLERLRK